MAHPEYLREKARQLRRVRKLTLDEIVERLALPRTTVYYWIADLPFERRGALKRGPRRGNRVMQQNYRKLREDAYAEGRLSFADLAREATFRDFVCLYIAEGYKRDRNRVSIANSDPQVVKLAARWMRRVARNPVTYWLQYHADQDPDALREFWGVELVIDPSSVRIQRKSNSAGLAARSWRSEHGVVAVQSNDTLLRARLQAWMDCLRAEWD